MNKTKIKHRLSTDDINRIIDMFLNDIKANDDLKEYIKNDSPRTIGLGIIATLDCVNENARWITKSNVKHISDTVVGAPLYYDHSVNSREGNGNFFYSKEYTTIDGAYTFLIGAFSTDYLYINDYTKKSFSVGYGRNKEKTCPTCKLSSINFYNIKDKNVVCGACGSVVEKNVDSSSLKILPHSIVWEKSKMINGDIGFFPIRSMAKLKQTHSNKVTDNNIYFMYIDSNASVSEISIVQNPADSLSAPLLAFSSTFSLSALLKISDEKNATANDSQIFNDVRTGVVTLCDEEDLDKMSFNFEFEEGDDNSNDNSNNDNNEKTVKGEYMKKYAWMLLKNAKDLGITLPDLADAYFDEKPESEARFLEAFTDDLATTAISAVWKGIVKQTESLKKTISDFQNEKDAYLADKEALVKEVADLKAELEKIKADPSGQDGKSDGGKGGTDGTDNKNPAGQDANLTDGGKGGTGTDGAGGSGDGKEGTSTDNTLPPNGGKKSQKKFF